MFHIFKKKTLKSAQSKTNFQQISDFEKGKEKDYDLIEKINFSLKLDIPSKESKTIFENEMCIIDVGTSNYGNGDIEALNDREKNHLYNTIIHELTHAKNYYNLSSATKTSIIKNRRSLAHWARIVLDEYSAYKEANKMYPETENELNGTQNDVSKVLNHMTKGYLEGAIDERFFEAFYDFCSALIVHSIVDDDFPKDKSCKKACTDFINDLERAYVRMPLTYPDYTDLGQNLMEDLLGMVPEDKREFFKYNTRIKMN